MNHPLQEFRAVEDLRPAPRATPTLVLWLMFLLLVCGLGLLLWPSASPGHRPDQTLAEAAAPAGGASTPAAEQARQTAGN